MIYRPDYYDEFRCTADKCRNTCCAQWEIDVDSVSLERFSEHPDIMEHISDGCIVLKEDGNCPFLNEQGLCKMILKYGEDMLCDVCTDHPRFISEVDDDEYIGVGISCEAACDLILNRKEQFCLIPPKQMPLIDRVFESEVLTDLLNGLSPDECSSKEHAELLLTFEILEPMWKEMLQMLLQKTVSAEERDSYIDSEPMKFKNLIGYFLYRHDNDFYLAATSARIIAELTIANNMSLEDVARMYSAEIEYSDINCDLL